MSERHAEKMDVGYRTLSFRADLDALLTKHGARLHFVWEGKKAKLQVIFPAASSSIAGTFVSASKNRGVDYVMQVEEKMP